MVKKNIMLSLLDKKIEINKNKLSILGLLVDLVQATHDTTDCIEDCVICDPVVRCCVSIVQNIKIF